MEKETERVIYKKRDLYTCSQENVNEIIEQNIFNLYFYLVKKVYRFSYSDKCRITLRELNKFLGNKTKNISNEKLRRRIIENLQAASIRTNILHTHKSKQSKKLKPGSYIIPIFGTIYSTDKYIEFTITKELMDLIKIENGDQYIKVKLSVAQKSNSKYTPKIFEFISSYASFSDAKKSKNNDIVISVAKLKEFLSIKKTSHVNFNSFNRSILKPVQKECTEFGLEFEYDFINEAHSKKVEFIKISMTNTQKNTYQEMMKKIKNVEESNDKIFLQAKEHARSVTLKFLQSELLNSDAFCKTVKSIELGKKQSMYIFNLHDDTYQPINFDDLKYILKYFRYSKENPKNDIADIGSIPESLEYINQMNIIKILKGEIGKWDK